MDTKSLKAISAFNYALLCVALTALTAILTVAMTLQYGRAEIPCPLCLLQRLAIFGICFGIIQSFRSGFSFQNTGISLLFAIFLLAISERQSLLDIYPRPGHEYVGSPVFGIHLPVWSVIIALIIIVAYALKLIAIGNIKNITEIKITAFPLMKRYADIVAVYVLLLCLINTVSVLLQCGLNQCHTLGYQLLP